MKKRWFYPAIYADGIKQLRMLGIVLLALCLTITLLSILLAYENVLLDVDDVAGILGAYMFIGPLLLTFSGFSFLFRRNASDFFHALPATRAGLMTSVAAAVLTWVWGTVIVTLLAAYGAMALCAWTVNFAHLPYQLMGYGFGSLLVMACCMIGISLTGTRFSAFIVSGLILFLPRFISFMCSLVLQAQAPLVIPSSNAMFFNISLNFPVGYFLSMFDRGIMGYAGGTSGLFLNAYTHVYTLVLALLYIALAVVAFCRRPSEVAEKSAPSRMLQHVYRSLITLPLLLVLSTTLISDGADSTAITVLVVTALLVYFLYELITTKKFRNLLRALYTLPIVVAFSFLVSWGTLAYGKAQMVILPQGDEIAGVQMYLQEDPSYQMLRVSEVTFTDPELNNIISQNLAACYEQYSRGAYRDYGDQETVWLTIRLKNGRSIDRTFQIQSADESRYLSLLEQNEDYCSAMRALPEDHEVLRIVMYDAKLNKEQLQEIWLKYRKELLALSDEERALHMAGDVNYEKEALEDGLYEGEASPQAAIVVQGSRGSKNFQYYCNFTRYTPQSANLAMRYCNQAAEANLQEARRILESEIPDLNVNVSAQVMRVEVDGKPYAGEWMHFYGGTGKEEIYGGDNGWRTMVDMLLGLNTSNPMLGETMVQYHLYINYMDKDGRYKNLNIGPVFAPATNEQAKMLLGLMAARNQKPGTEAA